MDKIDEFIMDLPNLIDCKYCKGKGYTIHNEDKLLCQYCDGSGKLFDWKHQRIEVSDFR